jgi:CheY-like chemotaxis protein
MDRHIGAWPTTAASILIVGGPDFVRQMREDVLSAGRRPVCALDGSEALEAITHEKPAMVVVDRAMPDIDRLWLLAKIERTPALARIPRAVIR